MSVKHKSRTWLLTSLLLLCAAPVWAQSLPHKQYFGPNLVQNPGFESGLAPWQIPAQSAEVASQARNGQQSMGYTNTDAARYNVFTQHVKVEPGQALNFSAWVKGQAIDGKETGREDPSQGAGVYIESYDDKNNYISGNYPTSHKGTFDWQQVQGEYIVPTNAATTQVGLYFTKGMTGSAWFDDVQVNVIPFRSFLQYPNYRGLVKRSDATPWKFSVQTAPQPGWNKAPAAMQVVLLDDKQKTVFKSSARFETTRETTAVSIPAPRNLPPGHYTLKQSIIDPHKAVSLESQYPIQVVESMPTTYIDGEGFTVTEGKRFFPLGIYLGPTEDDHLQRLKDSGFNTILSYSFGPAEGADAFLDRAKKHDLKVLFSVAGKEGVYELATEKIKQFKSHPAMLAWYINDELGPEWRPELQRRYDQVAQADYNHPAFQVLYQVGQLDQYFGTSDVLATDPYWVGKLPDLTTTTDFTRKTVAGNQGVAASWMVTQIFDWAVYGEENKTHQPNLDEMRNQSFQAIINGATGLIFYSYFDLWFADHKRQDDRALFDKRWPDVAAMTQEIKALSPVILHGKKTELALPAQKRVEVAAWEYEGKKILMLANPYYQEETITFNLPRGCKVTNALQGSIKGEVANGKLTLTLPSMASGAFSLEKS